MSKTARELNSMQKVAVLLISLGPDVSAQAFKHLNEKDVERLTLEIAKLRKVDSEQKEQVIDEFHELAITQDFIAEGGLASAREILEKAFGAGRTSEIISRVTTQVRPFEFARQTDPSHILSFIQHENAQTIALVLAYLEPEQAAFILSELPQERQADIIRRIAIMDKTTPDVISRIEEILKEKIEISIAQNHTQAGGVDSVVKVLHGLERDLEKSLLETLIVEDPELADEIEKKMFVFEDIVNLDGRSIQRVLRDVDIKDLQISLKVASDEVKSLVFRNMSRRMGDIIREELEVMGAVRLRDVEDAQSRIVAVIRRLEETGEIIITRGGGEDVVV